MAEWNTVRYDPNYPEPLDTEIIPLCDALNAAGFVTISSCCGHGRQWAHVWFEHSSDERIEKLARYVKAQEAGDYREYFSMFQKEILLEGYVWSIEIHLNEVYADTPMPRVMEKTVRAIESVSNVVSRMALEMVAA